MKSRSSHYVTPIEIVVKDFLKKHNKATTKKEKDRLKKEFEEYMKSSSTEDTKLTKIKKYFTTIKGKHISTKTFGLDVVFKIDDSKCYIEFVLGSSKDKICSRINKGKLYDELLVLYTLAHLPYATSCEMNINIEGEERSFHIIDRVIINLSEAFNPLCEQSLKKYTGAILQGGLIPIEATNAIHWLKKKSDDASKKQVDGK